MENLALKEFVKENLRKGYIRLLQLLRIFSIIYTKKEWKIENVH